MRDLFFDQLYPFFIENKNHLILSNDFGAPSLDRYKLLGASRYINAGISEQNIISVASGLALSGMSPIVYSISSFIISRAYEQIKIDICENNAPVTIVGVGPGYAYSEDGPTHHALDDVQLVASLPNIVVFSPSDDNGINYILEDIKTKSRARYIRLDRFKADTSIDIQFGYEKNSGFNYFNNGKHRLFITTGFFSNKLRSLRSSLGNEFPSHLDVYDLSMFQDYEFLSYISQFNNIIVIDEQYYNGGIGNLLLSNSLRRGFKPNVKIYGILKESSLNYGSRDYNLGQSLIDEKNLISLIKV